MIRVACASVLLKVGVPLFLLGVGCAGESPATRSTNEYSHLTIASTPTSPETSKCRRLQGDVQARITKPGADDAPIMGDVMVVPLGEALQSEPMHQRVDDRTLRGIAASLGIETRPIDIYLPTTMAEEWDSIVRARNVSFGDVFWLAWEVGKEQVLVESRGINEAPPVWRQCLPSWYVETAPAEVSELARRVDSNGIVLKEQLTLRVPRFIFDEVRDLANYRDGSLSGAFQDAYLTSRPYLIAWRDSAAKRSPS